MKYNYVLQLATIYFELTTDTNIYDNYDLTRRIYKIKQ